MCAKILINAGIKEIVYDEGYIDDLSHSLLKETDITIREFHPGSERAELTHTRKPSARQKFSAQPFKVL